MNALIGQIDYTLSQILAGDHHIVMTKKPKLQQGAHPPGRVFALNAAGELVPHTNAGAGLTPECVLLEQIDTGTAPTNGPDDAAPFCVHGVARLAKLTDSAGDAPDAAAIAALQAAGIYLV